jgi:hypothetical protein
MTYGRRRTDRQSLTDKELRQLDRLAELYPRLIVGGAFRQPATARCRPRCR